MKRLAVPVVPMGLCVCVAANAQPTITLQPSNLVVWSTVIPQFTVAVSGTGPFTYQWRFNGSNFPMTMVTVAAGTGQLGSSGDGGPATNATFSKPAGLLMDASGNLLIVDQGANHIRKIDTNGIVTSVAGTTNAGLSSPYGIALDTNGNLFIADTENNRICKVDTNAVITTVAGKKGPTLADTGDGGPATNATITNPTGVAVDAFGNIFIADQANRVRKVDTNGIISTAAGGGTAFIGDGGPATNSELSMPVSVAFNAAGDLFIADQGHHRVRKVDTNGIITTVAGNGSSGFAGFGGPATNAPLKTPTCLAFDAVGDLLISDTLNGCVYQVDTNGIITSLVGSVGVDGDAGNNAVADSPLVLISPVGIALDAQGELFFAESEYNKIREVVATGLPTLKTVGFSGDYSVVIISSSGSVTSSIATLIESYSPLISGVAYNSNASVSLGLLTQPGVSSRLLTTTNLVPPVTWSLVLSNTPGPTGFWQFTDTTTGGAPYRYYETATP